MDINAIKTAVATQSDGWRTLLSNNWDCILSQAPGNIPLFKILAASAGGGGSDLNDALAVDIEFAGEAAHHVWIEDSVTANTAGGALTVRGGHGIGSGAGGNGTYTAGNGGATGTGGTARLTGGTGGATSGAGGASAVLGGDAATSGAGGAATLTGGNGATAGAGGAATVTGGSGAAGTGNGGAASLIGGASGAGATGNGGAANVTGGAATSTDGNGGLVAITPGAKTGTGIIGSIFLRGKVLKKQGAPTAKTVTAAISAAELVTGIITTTGVTGPSIHQLPTGTLLLAQFPGMVADDSFDFYVINTGTGAADDATLTVNTDVTIVGNPTVGSLVDATQDVGSGHFRARYTGGVTFVVYRLA